MIRFSPKRSVKKGFAGWLVAAAVRLDGDEDRIELSHLLRVVKAKDPAAIPLAVLIEDAEVDRRALRRFVSPPGLKRGVLDTGLTIEIEGVEHERLALGIEDTTVGFARPAVARNVEDVGNIELSRPHELADVTIRGQVLLLVAQPALLVAVRARQYSVLTFARRQP